MSDSSNNPLKIDFGKLFEVIKTIDTPVKLSVLATVIAFIVLMFALIRLPDGNLRSILAGCMGLILLSSSLYPHFAAISKVNQSSATASQVGINYDVFISAKMDAARSDTELQEGRRNISDLSQKLKRHCGLKNPYYAGADMPERRHFEDPNTAIRKNIKNLRASSKYILIHPSGRISSSILVEAGMALALGKDSVFFVKNENDLPFLLRKANNASQKDGLPRITIHRYNNFSDILALVERSGVELFS